MKPVPSMVSAPNRKQIPIRVQKFARRMLTHHDERSVDSRPPSALIGEVCEFHPVSTRGIRTCYDVLAKRQGSRRSAAEHVQGRGEIGNNSR